MTHSPSPCGVPGHLLVPNTCLACENERLAARVVALERNVPYYEMDEWKEMEASLKRARESCGHCGSHMSEHHAPDCPLRLEMERLRARLDELLRAEAER